MYSRKLLCCLSFLSLPTVDESLSGIFSKTPLIVDQVPAAPCPTARCSKCQAMLQITIPYLCNDKGPKALPSVPLPELLLPKSIPLLTSHLPGPVVVFCRGTARAPARANSTTSRRKCKLMGFNSTLCKSCSKYHKLRSFQHHGRLKGVCGCPKDSRPSLISIRSWGALPKSGITK